MNISKLEQCETAILEKAKEKGLECYYLTATTLERYKRQRETLLELEKACQDSDAVITRTYVKGEANTYLHPTRSQYDKTSDSANKTVSTLLKIFKTYGIENAEDEIDPLMEMISGE